MVAGIFEVNDDFSTTGKLKEGLVTPQLEKKQWKKTSWDKVKLDYKGKIMFCEKSMIGMDFVRWFLRVLGHIKSYEETPAEINIENVSIYETEKEFPVVLVYDEIGCVIAPRRLKVT